MDTFTLHTEAYVIMILFVLWLRMPSQTTLQPQTVTINDNLLPDPWFDISEIEETLEVLETPEAEVPAPLPTVIEDTQLESTDEVPLDVKAGFSYDKRPLKSLKELAVKRGFKKTSRMKKVELLQLLRSEAYTV